LLGLIGLFMSVCGGGFIVLGLASGNLSSAGGIALIAVPSAIAGIFLVRASIGITRRNTKRDANADPEGRG